jgi:carbon storage regulator
MLVLSRKLGEEIIIHDTIRIKIVGVKGDRIRIGIDAPPQVSVNRAEVQERKMQFLEVPVGRCEESVDYGTILTNGVDDTDY